QTVTADIPLSTHKLTGVGDPGSAQDAATKNYVDNTFGSTVWSTGDVKLTLKAVADSGWLMMDDTTVGSGTSGAAHTGTTVQALFTLLWNNTSNTDCHIQDSTGVPTTRGGSAAADFAASKRMPLPKVLGRAMAIAGAGAGLTARNLASIFGEE